MTPHDDVTVYRQPRLLWGAVEQVPMLTLAKVSELSKLLSDFVAEADAKAAEARRKASELATDRNAPHRRHHRRHHRHHHHQPQQHQRSTMTHHT